MATKSTPAASVPPDNNAASAAEVHASAPVVEAHASAPAATQKNWPAIALGALAAILFVALFAVWFGPVKAGSSTSSSNVTLGAPASSVAVSVPAVVDATSNGGKLILAEMCTLHSDGTTRLISAQVDLKRAQDVLAKNKGSKEVKALIVALEEASKPLPLHAVIAEVPLSVLPNDVDCNDWRRQRAYQLVVGAPKPRANKS